MPRAVRINNSALDLQMAALQKFGGPAGLMRDLHDLYEEADSTATKLRILELVVSLVKGTEQPEANQDAETAADMEAIAKELMERQAENN